ncbi:MAG: hypothetical protein KDA28_00265, partial [Phycisphaerales bacterium]|nr:hypothetical protein [Phycisphaerales bacterium]
MLTPTRTRVATSILLAATALLMPSRVEEVARGSTWAQAAASLPRLFDSIVSGDPDGASSAVTSS